MKIRNCGDKNPAKSCAHNRWTDTQLQNTNKKKRQYECSQRVSIDRYRYAFSRQLLFLWPTWYDIVHEFGLKNNVFLANQPRTVYNRVARRFVVQQLVIRGHGMNDIAWNENSQRNGFGGSVLELNTIKLKQIIITSAASRPLTKAERYRAWTGGKPEQTNQFYVVRFFTNLLILPWICFKRYGKITWISGKRPKTRTTHILHERQIDKMWAENWHTGMLAFRFSFILLLFIVPFVRANQKGFISSVSFEKHWCRHIPWLCDSFVLYENILDRGNQ